MEQQCAEIQKTSDAGGDLEPRQLKTERMVPLCAAPYPIFEEKQYFFVSQRADFGPVYGNTDFIMDTVQTIVGSGYSPSTGRFTAPAKASYQFNVTISAQKTKQAAFYLVKNGEWIIRVLADSNPNWATSTGVAILTLEAGDKVWLLLRSEACYVNGGMHTAFSGFKL